MPATETFWRNLKAMHVVFAVSSVGMLGATVWMMTADHADEWRDTQRTFYALEAEKLDQAIESVFDEDYEARKAELTEQKQEAEANLAARESQLRDLRQQVEELERETDLAERAVRNQRAIRDVARADYDLAVRDQREETVLDALMARFDAEQQKVRELELALEDKEMQLASVRNELQQATEGRDEAIAQLEQLQSEVERLRAARNRLAPDNPLSAAKRKMMEWPIIDAFNSHLEVKQIWLPDLTIRLGMAESARFDRCTTCHLGIDRVESGSVPAFPHGEIDSESMTDWIEEGKYPHPFATHPRPELYLTAPSPHPISKFGCTICHEGQGSGTDFSNAAHYPNHPFEHEQWEDEYDFQTNHFWEYPMYPERFKESSCLKCHHNVVELGVNPTFGASAPKVYKGFQLVKTYGCFGCHAIHGFEAGRSIGPDLRLEPQTPEEADKYARDPNLVAGEMRKVGPSLRHIGYKTTRDWVEYWTEEPTRFRPSTRMPQFFHLTNLQDEEAKRLQPVEIAGIAEYLFDKSQPLDVLDPEPGYSPNVSRGRELFSQRGCLACHAHEAFPNLNADFGPNLSKVHAKVKAGDEGFRWLYTWLRDPERHHPRTRMPNLYLEPYAEGEQRIDPAADIAAFLLEKGPVGYQPIDVDDEALDELVRLFLSSVLTNPQVEETLTTRKYPFDREQIKGDEIELALEALDVDVSPEQWKHMKLRYIGRRTISRYGCYGCHDIPGFEDARPIGTTLQDWGRKDTTKLALEHIEEYLEHHGEPDGGSTHHRVVQAMKKARAGGQESGEFRSEEHQQRELAATYFYHSLMHHGRPGFIWQKLRQPRSYDYEKIQTKRYDERLRMPKFPITEEEIEAIATFVLGLVAEPPATEFLYQPTGPALARIEGERLLERFNCVGCHMVDLPLVRYGTDPDELYASDLGPAEHPEGYELLKQLKPPRDGTTGETITVEQFGEEKSVPVISFRGLVYTRPDPLEDEEFQEYTFDLWESIHVGEKELLPGARMIVPKSALVELQPARGGDFAEWLVESLMETTTEGNRGLAWQMAPPPLYKEGVKVQTPWLYEFLKEPPRLRHTTVLRMPRFNLDDDEARALADYFAAVDEAAYPYLAVPQRDPDYLERMNEKYREQLEPSEDYLNEAWKVLNAPVCIKCHSLGGRQYQVTDPKTDIRGPNLDYTEKRLRPDWLFVWLSKPQWFTPYTSMPLVFPHNQQQLLELFDGDATAQTRAVRDALMNYSRLMEDVGTIVYEPEPAAAGTGQGGE